MATRCSSAPSSNQYGSPQAEFEIPYGNLGQNGPYGQVAQRYAAVYGYDERAMAKIVVDQRVNANHTEGAIWNDKPLTVEDVLASPVIADPLHMLEIVMPCVGGAAVVVTNADLARKRSRNRPVWIKGFGEHVPFKTPTYAAGPAADADRQGGRHCVRHGRICTRADMDMVSIYDCYTITVLLSLEDAGFCEKGKGMSFVADHDLTFRGDFPLNTAGGQLGFGQPGTGRWHAPRLRCHPAAHGPRGATQVADCHRAFVSGNGGILSRTRSTRAGGRLTMTTRLARPMPVKTPTSRTVLGWLAPPRDLASSTRRPWTPTSSIHGCSRPARWPTTWNGARSRAWAHSSASPSPSGRSPAFRRRGAASARQSWNGTRGHGFATEMVNVDPAAIAVGMPVVPVFFDYPDDGVTLLHYTAATR